MLILILVLSIGIFNRPHVRKIIGFENWMKWFECQELNPLSANLTKAVSHKFYLAHP